MDTLVGGPGTGHRQKKGFDQTTAGKDQKAGTYMAIVQIRQETLDREPAI